MDKVIIGIDQSLSNTGLSIIKRGEKPLFFSIFTDKLRGVIRLSFIVDNILKIISENIDLNGDNKIIICREDYSYGSKGDVFNLGELGGCIDLFIYRKMVELNIENIEYYKIPPNSWKLLILGSGAVKKDTHYLLLSFDKTGIRFDNDNIADSYMIASAIKKMIDKEVNGESIKFKFGMISSKIRKKNKITERNISSINDDELKKMIEETLEEYLIFKL